MITKNVLIRINTFLFLVWSHFIIFSISLVVASYIIKIFISPLLKSVNLMLYDAIRISITFIIITLIQWFYKDIIVSFIKPSFNTAITIISSQALSILMIKRLLTKTVFNKYQLSYVAIFFCFIIPFYDFIMESFKKKKNKNHYSQTP